MLLDTHVVLWLLNEPDRIGPGTTEAITAASPRFVSSITLVEWHVKAMLGKLTIPPGATEALDRQGLTALAFDERHSAAMPDFPELARHDPFDRMLLAQARADGLRFATADQRILRLGYPWLVDAGS